MVEKPPMTSTILSRRELIKWGLLSGGSASLQAALLPGWAFLGTKKGSAPGSWAGYFPKVVLRTHHHKKVRFYEDLIKNKIVIINFMYATCDGKCPGTTANLVAVQRTLGGRVGRDIFMYSITLDPEHDTPQVLKEYAESYGVRPGWLFLTGDRSDIEQLRRKLGFVNPDPVQDKDKSQHIGIVGYGCETLNRWASCPAMSDPDNIVKYVLYIGRPVVP